MSCKLSADALLVQEASCLAGSSVSLRPLPSRSLQRRRPEPSRPLAPSPASSATASGAAIPGATVRIVNEDDRRDARGRQRRQGAYRVGGAGARPRTASRSRSTGSRRPCAGSCSRPARRPPVDVDAEPGAIHGVGGRHRPARRGGRAGRADSGVGRATATWSPTPAPST